MENILITNDDGVNARGLASLIEIAREFGKVTVVAPERGMSGKSHSITMFEPLFIRSVKKEKDLDIYALEGTPVDCVKVALDTLMDEPPTLVLSGINHGANTNLSVIYSGTMGAATEGYNCGINSIGFSNISHYEDQDLTATIYYTRKVISECIEKAKSYNKIFCLNVNVPNLPLEEIKGMKFCRQTKGYWKEDFELHQDPRGRQYYWLVGNFVNFEPEAQDTDEWAIANGYVSIVPVSTDMTDYKLLEECSDWNL